MSETPREIHHITQDDFEKSPEEMTESERISAALEFASRWGGIDGDNHKMWTLDHIVRILTGCPIVKSEVRNDIHQNPYTFDKLGESEAYQAFVAEYSTGEEGLNTYEWDTGIAP